MTTVNNEDALTHYIRKLDAECEAKQENTTLVILLVEMRERIQALEATLIAAGIPLYTRVKQP